jgi:CheY-like chemotaxis protein
VAEEELTVLLVEYNVEMRSSIKTILQPRYEIIEAGNGIQGFNLAIDKIPDFIISDVMMPEMDGLAFCA